MKEKNLPKTYCLFIACYYCNRRKREGEGKENEKIFLFIKEKEIPQNYRFMTGKEFSLFSFSLSSIKVEFSFSKWSQK